jgi:hypothetical protein
MKLRQWFAMMMFTFGLLQAPAAQESKIVVYPVKNRGSNTTINMEFPNAEDPSIFAGLSPEDRAALEAELKPREATPTVASFRQALYDLELKSQAQSAGGKVTLHRFTTESITFYLALAAVQIQSLIIHYSDNPSGLAQHLKSLKDPIANFSFYLFMLANGHTVNFLQKGTDKLEPASQMRAMKRIGYLGMAAGTLASGLGSEIMTALQDCGKVVFLDRAEKEKLLASKKAEDFKKDLSACENARKQWAGSAKVQQYIPQIASLLASTEVAQFLHISGKKLYSMGPAQLTKAITAKAGSAFRSIGFQVAFMAAPGGPVVRSISFLGKVMQFTFFTYVDHQINPYVQKFFSNQFKPAEFYFDAKSFEASMANAKRVRFQDERTNQNLATSIEGMTNVLKDWRQKQLGKFYSAHAVWGENTLRVIEQTAMTYSFYKSFIDQLFARLKMGHRISTKEVAPTGMINVTGYPLRTLPLYGVRIFETDEKKIAAAEDLYLQNPRQLEIAQMQTIGAVSLGLNTKLDELVATGKYRGDDFIVLEEIRAAFNGTDIDKIGRAIAKINQLAQQKSALGAAMLEIRQALGDPYPIFTPGMAFSFAYEKSSFNSYAMRKMDRPAGSGFSRKRTTDYLWMQMACGSSNKFYENTWGFYPSFLPPKILNFDLQFPDLCQEVSSPHLDANGRETSNIYQTTYKSTNGQKYNGISEVVYQNIRSEVLGEFTKSNGTHNFDVWWKDNVTKGTVELFREFDADYVKVLAHMTDNWQDKNLSYLDRLNRSTYLEKDALESLTFELSIYSKVLNEILSLREIPLTPNSNAKPLKLNENVKAAIEALRDEAVQYRKAALVAKDLRDDAMSFRGQQDTQRITALSSNMQKLDQMADEQERLAASILANLSAAAEGKMLLRAAQLLQQKPGKYGIPTSFFGINGKKAKPGILDQIKVMTSANRKSVDLSAIADGFRADQQAAIDKRWDYMSARGKQDKERIAILTREIARLDAVAIRFEKQAEEARPPAETYSTQEIANLVNATQARIDILRKFKVEKNPLSGNYEVFNFPEKEDSKAAAKATEESLKALTKLLEGLMKELKSKGNVGSLNESHAIILSKVLSGLEGVVQEVGSMTMAIYTTKYHLEDQYEELINDLKGSKNETKPAKSGVNPR